MNLDLGSMTTPEILNLVGRIFVAFYFLWSVFFNYRAWDFHISEFKRIGISSGAMPLSIGLVAAFAGSCFLMFTPTAVYGAVILIAFTIIADGLFHRYWTYENPQEATIHKFFLFEHVALIGGIIGLAAPHL